MSEFVDPYIDPTTGILRNLAGSKTQDDLDQIEADVVEARTVDLPQQRIKATRDLIELRAIHRYSFQDVYAWAGELRTVDIRKNLEGSEFFVPVSLIERAATFTAIELAEDDQLRVMNRTTFVARRSHHYDQLNYIHPFREGNGCTQRVFWDRVARDAGWRLTWLAVSSEVNDNASRIASETQNLAPLIEMFSSIVEPLP